MIENIYLGKPESKLIVTGDVNGNENEIPHNYVKKNYENLELLCDFVFVADYVVGYS